MRTTAIHGCAVAVTILGVTSLVGCAEIGEDDDGAALQGVTARDLGRRCDDPFAEWSAERARRQSILDAYLAEHSAELDAFLHRPLGSAGVPAMLFRGFGAAFPDVWGDGHLSAAGFMPDPFRPGATDPLGIGIATGAGGLEVATLTCGACHTGSVVGPDGTMRTLIGAPNTRFNQFRSRIERTVTDPRYLAIFGENPLTTGVRDGVLAARAFFDATIGGFTYNPLRIANPPDYNAELPGNLDAFSIVAATFTRPEILDPARAPEIIAAIMPPAPAPSDIMSVWRQGARAVAHWDGNIASPIYRSVVSDLTAVGDPAAVDFENASTRVDFMGDLPPPPYPFDVDMGMARVGRVLYLAFCAGCHADGNTTLFPASDVGTDPNRLAVLTPLTRERLIAALRTACTDPAQCDVTDDEIVPEVAPEARGYLAVPLDGIWARAPYLHNGSVPTLYDLLVPGGRPATFYRGSRRYDERRVGFVSDASAADEAGTQLHDTTRSGMANTGHDTRAYNGIDWSRNRFALAALLEYLKTL